MLYPRLLSQVYITQTLVDVKDCKSTVLALVQWEGLELTPLRNAILLRQLGIPRREAGRGSAI